MVGGNDDFPIEKYLYTAAAVTLVATAAVNCIHHNRQVPTTDDSMQGHIIIITGANSGIGRAAAFSLALRGAEIILARRNLDAGENVAREITKKTCNSNVYARELDLTKFSSIERFSGKVKKCHVLINNAGAMFPNQEHVGRIEKTSMTNHIGPTYLTSLLLPTLKRTAQQDGIEARVVNVASRLEKNATTHNQDPQTNLRPHLNIIRDGPLPYDMWKAYANSKLYNILMTKYLSNSLQDLDCSSSKTESNATWPRPNISYKGTSAATVGNAGVTINAVTPGVVNTGLGRWSPPWLLYLSYPLRSMLMRSPEKGAETVVYAASSPDLNGISGAYFGDCKQIEPSAQAQSMTLAANVWEVTKEIIAEETSHNSK